MGAVPKVTMSPWVHSDMTRSLRAERNRSRSSGAFDWASEMTFDPDRSSARAIAASEATASRSTSTAIPAPASAASAFGSCFWPGFVAGFGVSFPVDFSLPSSGAGLPSASWAGLPGSSFGSAVGSGGGAGGAGGGVPSVDGSTFSNPISSGSSLANWPGWVEINCHKRRCRMTSAEAMSAFVNPFAASKASSDSQSDRSRADLASSARAITGDGSNSTLNRIASSLSISS